MVANLHLQSQKERKYTWFSTSSLVFSLVFYQLNIELLQQSEEYKIMLTKNFQLKKIIKIKEKRFGKDMLRWILLNHVKRFL